MEAADHRCEMPGEKVAYRAGSENVARAVTDPIDATAYAPALDTCVPHDPEYSRDDVASIITFDTDQPRARSRTTTTAVSSARFAIILCGLLRQLFHRHVRLLLPMVVILLVAA